MARTLFPAPQHIAAGTITLALLASNIGIDDARLASGADFVKRTGTVAFTANQSMGGNLLTNLGTPVNPTDAAPRSYVDALFNSAPYLGGADTVATTNVALSGLQTLNGYTLTAGDIVFLTAQTTGTENGPWVAAAGAWARPVWYAAGTMLREGSTIVIERGNFAGYQYVLSTQGGATVGTTATTFLGIATQSAYTAGSAISITGNTIAVKYGNGIELDGTGQLQVKTNGASLNVTAAGVKLSDGTGAGQLYVTNGSNAPVLVTPSGDVQSVSAAGAFTLSTSIRRLANFVYDEVLGGTVDGVNTGFTLAQAPTAGTLVVYVNGQRQRPGAGNDYSLSGAAVTMLYAPVAGSVLVADYQK